MSPNIRFVWRVSVRILFNRTIGSSAARARNSIYFLTFSILLLRKHGATDGAMAFFPIPFDDTPELFAEAVALFLGFLWLAFLIHRILEESDFALSDATLVEGFSDFDPVMVVKAAILFLTAILNIGVPLILTFAVLLNLDVSPTAALVEFVAFAWAEILPN
ncbi:hypothetical protein [Primorskyibacter sedentarius]|nr:hypothetical protein [Primorskyibacter sedentarius]